MYGVLVYIAGAAERYVDYSLQNRRMLLMYRIRGL